MRLFLRLFPGGDDLRLLSCAYPIGDACSATFLSFFWSLFPADFLGGILILISAVSITVAYPWKYELVQVRLSTAPQEVAGCNVTPLSGARPMATVVIAELQ